jgi:hypothetical protein
MKGIVSGYLNNCPFEAFILAIIIQIILSVAKAIIMGIPMIMKHKGIARTIYSKIDKLKFREFLPLRLIHTDSSLLESQHIRGPIIPPNGKK